MVHQNLHQKFMENQKMVVMVVAELEMVLIEDIATVEMHLDMIQSYKCKV